MVVIKHYAAATSRPRSPTDHISPHAALGLRNPAESVRSKSSSSRIEKRTSWFVRRLTIRQAPTEPGTDEAPAEAPFRRWSTTKSPTNRDGKRLERGQRELKGENDGGIQQEDMSLRKVAMRPSRPLWSSTRRDRPNLSLIIPEYKPASSVQQRVIVADTDLNLSARYSPVASSPFVSLPWARQNTRTEEPDERSSQVTTESPSSPERPYSAQGFHHRPEQRHRLESSLPGSVSRPRRPFKLQRRASAPISKSTHGLPLRDRGQRLNMIQEAQIISTPILNKPLPPLPQESLVPAPLRTKAGAHSTSEESDTISEETMWEQEGLGGLESWYASSPTGANLSQPFSTFEPSAFMLDEDTGRPSTSSGESSGMSSVVSSCSSVSPPSSVSTPPPIPPRSCKRPTPSIVVSRES